MDSSAPPAVAEITSEMELENFRSRITAFLRSQPDVGQLDDLGDGIYGVEVAGISRGVSLVIQQTQ